MPKILVTLGTDQHTSNHNSCRSGCRLNLLIQFVLEGNILDISWFDGCGCKIISEQFICSLYLTFSFLSSLKIHAECLPLPTHLHCCSYMNVSPGKHVLPINTPLVVRPALAHALMAFELPVPTPFNLRSDKVVNNPGELFKELKSVEMYVQQLRTASAKRKGNVCHKTWAQLALSCRHFFFLLISVMPWGYRAENIISKQFNLVLVENRIAWLL